MAREKKAKVKKRIVMSNMVDWAIIDKRDSKAIAIFNPQGNLAALRRVAVKIAIQNKLTYNNIKLIPIENLSAKDRELADLPNAAIAVDEKTAKKAEKKAAQGK